MNSDEKYQLQGELGTAMGHFANKLEAAFAGGRQDEALRRSATEDYRCTLDKVAAQGVEISLAWHTLATWTDESKERIALFSRALSCIRAEILAQQSQSAKLIWFNAHLQADCLYEIGSVHAAERDFDAARKFLEEALPLSRQANDLCEAADGSDTGLEGKVAALLLQLSDGEAEE
jgi:tetratricopeptide (TPR) repeat protein